MQQATQEGDQVFSFGDILTNDDAKRIFNILKEEGQRDGSSFESYRKRVRDEVLAPKKDEIKAVVGEVDLDHLAYAVSGRMTELVYEHIHEDEESSDIH